MIFAPWASTHESSKDRAMNETRSEVLPSDAFALQLRTLSGLPNGAQTQAALVQDVDFYGNISNYILQTVKWDKGTTVFVTVGSERFVLPPKVVGLLLRQQEAVTRMVRRRHGLRLAEERKANGQALGGFTPE